MPVQLLECPNSLVAFFPAAVYRSVGSSSVLPELLRSVNKDLLTHVQFLRNGAVRLTFKTAANCERVLASGIRYSDVPLRLAPAGTQSLIVYLRDCPSEVPDNVIRQFFTSFGEVHSISHSTHQGFPELRDGNRAVRISLSKDIPGVVSIAGFECRVWYRRQPAFCEICKKLGHRSRACPLDGLCRRCLQPGHQARSCRNTWAAPRPAAPAAPAPPVAPVASADVSIANPSGTADASAEADLEMSDVEYVPTQSEADSDALSMVEDASGDEAVVRAASQLSPPRSPRGRHKRRRRAVSSHSLPEPVDMDLSVEEGPSHRLFKTSREVWDDKLSWEEIRARKLRRRVSVASLDPSSTPVLFPSPSPPPSLSTPVAQATPVPSPFSSDGSIVDSVRSPTPPCLSDVTSHAMCFTAEEDSGEVFEERFDFGPHTRQVLASGLCFEVFRVNYYLSHPDCRASYSLPDADHPVLPDVPPSLFVSR